MENCVADVEMPFFVVFVENGFNDIRFSSGLMLFFSFLFLSLLGKEKEGRKGPGTKVGQRKARIRP